MSDRLLLSLARQVGLAPDWTDAAKKKRRVSPEILRAVLRCLGFPAASRDDCRDSLARLRALASQPPLLAVVPPGARLAAQQRLLGEDGAAVETDRAPLQPGYYPLADGPGTLAVVPAKAAPWPRRRGWGIAVQLYSLRGSPGFGDFSALAKFAEQAAEAGADAVAISPVHALFGARPDHIGPYSPSSRLFLNPLYAAAGRQKDRPDPLVDWPARSAEKWEMLRRRFAAFRGDPGFDRFVAEGGTRLLAHARFEVLDGRFCKQGIFSWHQWPDGYADSRSPVAQALGADDAAVAFQLFLQWRAEEDLAAAQARAKASGMAIGLIADLAVGMDPAGSHAWSARQEVLNGLSIGAPPDIYNANGQNWGLTNFSPWALKQTGYDGFLATLRAAMAHGGGMRLDHAMGLTRLWVIPEGARPKDGVYLSYPFDDLSGLLKLESLRHGAVVIGEDLGTVPRGFRGHLAGAGIAGMRVLWFERDKSGAFIPPPRWDADGVALSTTHDLPTLAGWWSGRDIAWHRKLRLGDAKAESRLRVKDRGKLWNSLKSAKAAQGPPPGPAAPASFVDAAIAALAQAPAPLTLVPVEDLLGMREQPNIPGTVAEHPNWRRRLESEHPLGKPAARRRAARLTARRS